MHLATPVNSIAPSDVGSVTEGVIGDSTSSIAVNAWPSSLELKTSGIRHPPSSYFTCLGIGRARDIGFVSSSRASARTMTSRTALFDRQLRKLTALPCGFLETDWMLFSCVGGFSIPAPTTIHRPSRFATAKAWQAERGQASLPAALSVLML
ncbi:hypothetical protein MTO96_013677 [Rhipicephalus appendiculatus]